jgi:outer membrane protein
MFRLVINNKFLYTISLIMIATIFTYSGLKAQSLNVALANAYSNHPLLFSERIGERLLTEDVAEALSGWKPQVYVDGSLGKTLVTTKTSTSTKTNSNLPMSVGIVVSKKLYDGGKTSQNVKVADTKLIANKTRLSVIENQILLSAVKAYFNLLKEQDLLDVAVKNKDVIKRQLEATKDRFEVGDLTITDVSQAEARLSDANANLVKADADLNSARAIFFSDIGLEAEDIFYPKDFLVIPQNLQSLIDDVKKFNANVAYARKIKLVAEEELNLALKDMSLSLDLQASANQAWDPNTFFEEQRYFDVSANLKMPLYKGGSDKAIIRKYREKLNKTNSEIDDILRKESEKAMLIWNNIESLNSQIIAFNSSIKANEIALDGVVQEENVGARTVIDVLDAENELFRAKANLIRANISRYIASYELIELIGGMTARNLKLPVSSFYDNNEYYNKMKKMTGNNDASFLNLLNND